MILHSWNRYQDFGLLLLRLGMGGMFAYAHGWPKMAGGPEKWEQLGNAIGVLGVPVFLPVFWGFMAAFAEFAGAILLALGLLFRPAAFLLFFTMLVASVMHVSQGDDFGKVSSRPIELAILFGTLLLIGPGRYALDSLIAGSRK